MTEHDKGSISLEGQLLGNSPSCGYTTCRRCGREGEYRNVGRQQWGICHACRVCWLLGENLFSSWRHETEETWRQNQELLDTFEELTGGLEPEAIRFLLSRTSDVRL